jgi:hypothetical protein
LIHASQLSGTANVVSKSGIMVLRYYAVVKLDRSIGVYCIYL